jgi:hypothetical protein
MKDVWVFNEDFKVIRVEEDDFIGGVYANSEGMNSSLHNLEEVTYEDCLAHCKEVYSDCLIMKTDEIAEFYKTEGKSISMDDSKRSELLKVLEDYNDELGITKSVKRSSKRRP